MSFPALMRADKVQKRAKKAGFDWDNVKDASKKLDEELEEFKEALLENDETQAEEEFGDLLFSMVNVSRFMGINSEKALHAATDKFINRFEKTEIIAQKKGIDMKKSSLETLDRLWEEAKRS